MSKKILLNKLIIELDEEGMMKTGTVLYKLNENGIISKSVRSLSIVNMGYNKLQFNNILAKIRNFVKKTEGVDDE